MPLPLPTLLHHGSLEPMQVDVAMDADTAEAEESVYIVHNATLDLETYISGYKSLAKLQRLVFIADHCPALRAEALKMALSCVMATYNTGMYKTIHRKLVDSVNSASPLPDAIAGLVNNLPSLDTTWIEVTSKRAAQKLEKLDTDLKNYRGNSIKESIRRGHDDLGDHYLDCGNLHDALKCYSRARDYCTNAKHVIHMCLNVIRVSIYLQNWPHVLNYMNKAEPLLESSDPSTKDSAAKIQTKLKCAAGLAELSHRKYRIAARNFLLANFDHCDFPEILSPNNVAIYGSFCALATYNREELQKHVIGSSSFKLFLELEPQVREMLHTFYNSKYGACLKILEEMKDNLLLDIFLAPHVRYLYTQIRNKALCQYFSPYVSADMNKMADAFNTTVLNLENELMQLILDGQINARIDSHSKILFAKDADLRQQTFEKAMSVGSDYQRATASLLLRAALLRNNLSVRATPGQAEMSLPAAAGSTVRN